MNKKLQLFGFMLVMSFMSFAQVGIGTTSPEATAALDVSATDKGFLLPRMTTAQRIAISSPATSLTVFDTDTNSFWSYIGDTWVVSNASGKFVDGVTSEIAYYDGRVGIGINNFSNVHMLYVDGVKDTDGVNTTARIDATYNGTGTSTATYGLTAFAINDGDGTIGTAIGTQGTVQNPSGTIDTAVGSWEQVDNLGTVAWGAGIVSETINGATGTMTSANGHSLNVYNRLGGSIGELTLSSMYMENTGAITGDAYGLWVGGVSTGTVAGDAYAIYIENPFTNVSGDNFALYSENTANSYFEGSLGIGTSSPQRKVHISGAMRLDPQAIEPTDGELGDLYVNTDGNLYFHDGSDWRAVQLAPVP